MLTLRLKRAPGHAPKPILKVFEPSRQTPNLGSTTTENGSKAILGCDKKSPAKNINAVKVIDKSSKLAPETAKDEKSHELSRSKKRLTDADLESKDHKKTKQNPVPSSNPEQSGGNGEKDRKLMSEVAPAIQVPTIKRGAEEDLEGPQQKRQKTGSEPGRDGLSTAQIAQDRKVRQRAAGLRNASNTCYYNAVLQTLVQTEPIREFCLARADKFAHTITSDVVLGKHTTRQNAQTQAGATDLFANVDPDDV